jgi:hypothetical protein
MEPAVGFDRRPADCQSVAFPEGRYLGHDILAEKLKTGCGKTAVPVYGNCESSYQA